MTLAELQDQNVQAILMVFSFVFGSVVGSFLNVCIHRFPLEQSVVTPPSACPKCGQRIGWADNIPILSWIMLGARCRGCATPISWRYPAVEALTGLVFLLVFLKHGLVLATPVYMLLSAGLIVLIFTDLEHWIIPNEVTFGGMGLGIAWSLAVMAMGASSGGFIEGTYEGVFDAFIGLAVGGGIILAIDFMSAVVFKKPGMGMGDTKLLAMLGTFFGWKGALFIIMAASIIGSIVGIPLLLLKGRGAKTPDETAETPPDTPKADAPVDDDPIPEGNYLPFGPCLALAGFAMIFFGPEIMEFVTEYYTLPDPVTVNYP